MLELSVTHPDRCHRLSRRAFLSCATAGAAGFSLGDLLALSAAARDGSPRAHAVIMLWLWGGPSHLDTFDMKPDAPLEYRGPFEPIATAVPGVRVCELLTGLARRAGQIRALACDAPRVERPRCSRDDRLDREHRRGSRTGRPGEYQGPPAEHRRNRRPAAPGRSGVAPPVRHPRQPAPPGAEARCRRRGRVARQPVRPVPDRLRAGRRIETARCDASRRSAASRRLKARWDLLHRLDGSRAGTQADGPI